MDHRQVVCVGDGLRFAYLDEPAYANIDTRNAGAGELTVFCQSYPAKVKAFCELKYHNDGTFTLTMRPQDIGQHLLYVKYDGIDVIGSPFKVLVSNANMLVLTGNGLKNKIFSDRDTGDIVVDTRQAGEGDVKFRMGGPKGAFELMTRVEDKMVHCTYKPRKPGVYVINIQWNDVHVPGSPFQVYLAYDGNDLANYEATHPRVAR